MGERHQVFVLGLVLLTEILGWSLILPFLPFMALDFGASAFTIGLIISSFSLFQFISSPIIGKLSDKYGRKKMLVLSQISTFFSFIILGFANSVNMIFLSRIVDGVLGSNMSLTNAYVGDITKGKNKAKSYTYFSAIKGVGMFIGPAVGGFLAEKNYALPSFLAAGISFITIILIVLFLDETVKVNRKIKFFKKDFLPVRDLVNGLKDKHLKNNYLELFFFLLGFFIITTNLALYLDSKLGLGPRDVGMILVLIGGVRVIFQAGFLPRLIDNYNNRYLEILGLFITAVSMISFLFITSRFQIYVLGVLISIGIAICSPLMVDNISSKAKKSERGKVLGVYDSFSSMSRIIAPLIGGYLIQTSYPDSVGVVSGLFLLIALYYSKKLAKEKVHLFS